MTNNDTNADLPVHALPYAARGVRVFPCLPAGCRLSTCSTLLVSHTARRTAATLLAEPGLTARIHR